MEHCPVGLNNDSVFTAFQEEIIIMMNCSLGLIIQMYAA